MAPVWAGESADYPVHREKVAILEGDGVISDVHIGNSERTYTLDAKSNVRMIDYTFFFPGWKVYVNGVEVPPEYQDPSYRGVMTLRLSAGTHHVVIRFIPTRIRKIGWVVSGFALAVNGGILFLFLRKQKKIRHQNR